MEALSSGLGAFVGEEPASKYGSVTLDAEDSGGDDQQ